MKAPVAPKDKLGRFLWQTADHQIMAVDSMTTKHLFFTFKMLANTILPEHLQIKPSGRLYQASDHYIRAAMQAMEETLNQRQVPELWQREIAALKINLSLIK